jgi:hypothetical protein
MIHGFATYCDECGVETDNKKLCTECNEEIREEREDW